MFLVPNFLASHSINKLRVLKIQLRILSPGIFLHYLRKNWANLYLQDHKKAYRQQRMIVLKKFYQYELGI